MPWSAEQREWLQALGYEPLARTPQSSDMTDAPVIDAGAAPAAADAMRSAGATRPAPATRRGEGEIDPLLRAMLRAARTDAVDEVRTIAGDLHRVRTDPAAKRAAWPRLRAMRARNRK
jgi:hypothetical protein